MTIQGKIIVLIFCAVFFVGCAPQNSGDAIAVGTKTPFFMEILNSDDESTLAKEDSESINVDIPCSVFGFGKTGGENVAYVEAKFQTKTLQKFEIDWLLEQTQGCEDFSGHKIKLEPRRAEVVETGFARDILDVKPINTKIGVVQLANGDYVFSVDVFAIAEQSGQFLIKNFFDFIFVDEFGINHTVAELEIRWKIQVYDGILPTAPSDTPMPNKGCKGAEEEEACETRVAGDETPPATPVASNTPDYPGYDTATPDTPVPDTATPDTPVPDTPVPDTPVPDTPVPDTPVPDTPVPDTPVPDTPGPSDKVTICTKDGKTKKVKESELQDWLDDGATKGACP